MTYKGRVKSATAACAVALLLLIGGLVSSGPAQGNSPWNIGGVSALNIFVDGVCDPGVLQTPITQAEPISSSSPKNIAISGDVFECFAVGAPGPILVDSELFGYKSVNAETVSKVSTGQGAPFTMNVDDTSTFSPNGTLLLNDEEMAYDTKTATSFHVIARGFNGPHGGTTAEQHEVGTLVREQSVLRLVGRAQPTSENGSETAAAKHNGSPTITSPILYLNCRTLTVQTVQAGDDPVVVRSRCYARFEPDGFWLTHAQNVALSPHPGELFELSHLLSTGTIVDQAGGATTISVTVTGVQAFDCFSFVDNQRWIQLVSTTTVKKVPPDTGEFRVNVYDNSGCTGSTVLVLGANDGTNLENTRLSDQDADTDDDGCSDAKELGAGIQAGGLRDPWNVYDVFDTPVGTAGQPGTTGRNSVVNIGDVTRVIGNFNRTDSGKAATPNRNDDILATTLDPSKYHPAYDRGSPVGLFSHNLSSGDGVVNIGDVTRVIAQFNTVCV